MTRSVYWWRVEVSTGGAVVSTRLAERPEQDGGLVFYVRARDIKHAGKLALNAYMRVQQRKRNRELAAKGLCRCGRRNDNRRGRCSVCRVADQEYKARARAKARGDEVPPLDRRETLTKRRALEAAEAALSVLLECQQAADACRTMGEFRRWLADRIQREGTRGRKAA